jgi:hypothetical protein
MPQTAELSTLLEGLLAADPKDKLRLPVLEAVLRRQGHE